nr:MFS transporter [Austwickia chelonae]
MSSLSMPIKARLIDRLGAPPVLRILGGAELGLGGCVLALGATNCGAVIAWLVLAALMGLCAPPLGPLMRALWRAASADQTDVAYALDGAAEEVVWLLGPVGAGMALALWPAWMALAALPLFLFIGCVAIAVCPLSAVREESKEDPGRGLGSAKLVSRFRLPALIALIFGVTTSFSVTGIAARADAVQRLDMTGIIEGALGVGSIVGSLAAGMWLKGRDWRRALGLCFGGFGVALAGGAALSLSYWSMPGFFVVGLFMAPIWIIIYRVVDDAVPPDCRTEASTWISTLGNVGSSMGTAVTGGLVGVWGASSAHWAGAMLGVTVSVLCFALGVRRDARGEKTGGSPYQPIQENP